MNPIAGDGERALVSVCIPCYNAAGFIGETIRSVLDSTYSNLEIIVSDDASTDGAMEIVEGFDDERIRLFRNETRLGVPKNWNRAMEKAKGEYIGLLNHDDLYGPFWLSFAVYNLEKRPHVGWATTASRLINHLGRTISAIERLPETREYSRREAFSCVGRMGALTPVFIARRRILDAVGRYDESEGAYADHGLHLRLASRWPMHYSANPLLAAKRIHAGNLSRRVRRSEKGIRAIHCLEMLNKVRDSALPETLHEVAERCNAYFYGIILDRCKTLLEKEDLEMVQRLIRQTPTGWRHRRPHPTPTVREAASHRAGRR